MIMYGHRLLLSLLLALTLSLGGPVRAQFDSLRKLGKSDDAPTKKVACFKLEGMLIETPVEIPPIFSDKEPQSLKEVLARLKAAQQDDGVVAVVVDFQNLQLGFAQLEELYSALKKFAVLDKEVFIHADSYTNLTYALATAASHVSIVPTGDVWLTGLYSESLYIRGLIDKIGATPDFERCTDCDYKSAAESYMRTSPSEEAQKMYNWLFDGLYEAFIKWIAEGRGMTAQKARAIVDNGPYPAEEALKAGLIDSIKYRQDFVAELKSRYGDTTEFAANYGKDDAEDLPQDFFSVFARLMQMLNPEARKHTEPSVAIVYVDGVIMTGEGESSPFGSSSGAYSTTLRKALDEAAEDDSVKAVVLRVSSPGGSALASEIILNAGRRVAARKPFIVSMGNVAASGGYYVSCLADTIFADAGTVTASIGVLGGKLVTTGMWDKLGITWHPHQRGDMAGMFSSASVFNETERAKLIGYMDSVYDVFKRHVETGRKGRLTKSLDEMAGGRVFTGAQALELGLVDRIGGMDDAIKFAAEKAGVYEYEIRIIPEPPSVFDLLMGTSDDDEFARMSPFPGLYELPLFKVALPVIRKVDPLRAAALLRAVAGLEVIHSEGAATLMPEEFIIR